MLHGKSRPGGGVGGWGGGFRKAPATAEIGLFDEVGRAEDGAYVIEATLYSHLGLAPFGCLLHISHQVVRCFRQGDGTLHYTHRQTSGESLLAVIYFQS